MELRRQFQIWRQLAEIVDVRFLPFTGQPSAAYGLGTHPDGGVTGVQSKCRSTGANKVRLPSEPAIRGTCFDRVPFLTSLSLVQRGLSAKPVQSRFQLSHFEMGRALTRATCFISPLLNPLCFGKEGFFMPKLPRAVGLNMELCDD